MSDGRDNLTHFSAEGDARMVDVGGKESTTREAEAQGSITMHRETLLLIREQSVKKGDVLGVARIAGIMAAKRTADLIPLCHPLPLSAVEISLSLNDDASKIDITARARTEGKTGVEMEALTAVTVAALTVYDMCKAVDREMHIIDVRLTRKSGGRSGTFTAS